MSVKKKKYVFLTKWNKHCLECACLFHNPMCDSKVCEEIELEYSPYQDLEECMKARRYQRKNGALRQK